MALATLDEQRVISWINRGEVRSPARQFRERKSTWPGKSAPIVTRAIPPSIVHTVVAPVGRTAYDQLAANGARKTHMEVIMSTAAAAERPAATDLGQGVVIAKKEEATYVEGRRDWMKYRELGVTKASSGRIRAQITSASQGLSEPTGWHVHLCEGQFVYMLRGWVDLEFAGGKTVRIEAGDSAYIPGNTPHNEIATSDQFELVEISVPAEMGTEPCEAPA